MREKILFDNKMALERVRQTAWRVGTRRVGRGFLVKVLNYYKVNQNNSREFLKAYNKYLNALNNKSARMARANAELASSKFVNTLFKIYEKQNRQTNPVSNGITSGVQKSILYWMPGVVLRGFVRGQPRYRSAPTPKIKSISRI